MEDYIAQGKKTDAYEAAATALLYAKDNDLQQKKGALQADYKKTRIAEAQKYLDAGDKKNAFTILRKANKLCPCDEFAKIITDNADFRKIIWGDDFQTVADNEDADAVRDVTHSIKLRQPLKTKLF